MPCKVTNLFQTISISNKKTKEKAHEYLMYKRLFRNFAGKQSIIYEFKIRRPT